MKNIFLSSLIILTYCTVSGQAVFQNINYNEKLEPGLVLELPNKPEIVQKTVLEKLMVTGYKPETTGALFWKSDKVNGFYVFKQVTLPELKNQTLDLYLNVEKLENYKNKTKLYMLVSKGYDNFISPDSDTEIYRAARSFLNSFIEETAAFKLRISIEELKESIADSEKSMRSLTEHENEMVKKMDNLNEDLRKNKEDQEKLQNKLQQQNSTLEESSLQLERLKK